MNSFAFSSENNFILSFISKVRFRTFPFKSQRTNVWNRRTSCVENISLQSPLKQAGIEASRFHVVDNFYHGIQHILQRNKQSSASKRTSVNDTEFNFYFRSNFLNFFWKPECDPIIVGAPWVQTPQNIFTAALQNQKRFTLQNTCTCSLQFLTKQTPL